MTGKTKLTVYELSVFAMFGTLMFLSRLLLASLPNINMVGMLVMLLTVVYRFKALIPLYIYVALEGLFSGFAPWWITYLYIWAVLWAVTMLLPVNMKPSRSYFVYPAVCGLFGLAFGTLCAPSQMLMFGLPLSAMLGWIASGLVFDCVHMIGNVAFGLLIPRLSDIVERVDMRCRNGII